MKISRTVLPEELVTEVLSFLPVKSILRFKCVCKSWKLLISDPFFVQKHLHLSQKRNTHLALIGPCYYNKDCWVVPFPLNSLLLNLCITIPILPHHRLKYRVIGCINGLFCLSNSYISQRVLGVLGSAVRNTCFYLWNPATKKISQKLGSIVHSHNAGAANYLRFAFGYDKSTYTYKVVAFCPNEVRIFSFGSNVWKNIEPLPIVPLYRLVSIRGTTQRVNEGVYLNGTINWLTIPNSKYYWQDCNHKHLPEIDRMAIISLDLSTETYRQLLPPKGLHEVPSILPTIAVLGDCLCLSYHFKRTQFVIWLMLKFGVQESWTLFLKISYEDLQIYNDFPEFLLYPLCFSEDGDTIILASNNEKQAFFYNWRENRVEKTRITNNVMWMFSHYYIESLVSTG